MRLSLTTDSKAQALRQPAVCLIDEIDAHLHPKWQAKIVPALRSMFPNVQFISTTHSPYVIETVEPYQIFVLKEAAHAD